MVKSFLKNNYILIISSLIFIAGLYFISLYSYLLYHSIVELFTVVIAFGIFVVAWNSKKFLGNDYLLFIGIAYLYVALLDLFHTLAYKGMGIFTAFSGSNLATQLWISSRYLESISLLLAVLFIFRKINYKVQFISYSIFTTLILLSIFYWKIFPVCYIEGLGLTPFKVISEYIVSFILLASIFFLYLYRKEFSRTVFRFIIVSISVTILSELSFTLYLDVYGFFNQLGHFLKLFSFFLIYKAIIETGFSQPFDLLFFKLKQSEKELKESEKKFSSLYFSMNEGACLYKVIYDRSEKPVDYRIIDINNAYESMIGVKRNQVIGKRVSEFYKTDIDYTNLYAKVADSGKPERFEAYFSSIKKYFSISVFSPERGKIAALFSDITEHKKNEKKIENLSRFPSENPNPVMRINDKNLVIYANEPAEKILKQLGNKKRSIFLEFLHNSIKGIIKKDNNKLKTVEIKMGKSTYGFTIIPVKDLNYFNIYGKDITASKKAESLYYRVKREKYLNKERNKLARELHDTVTQTLFSANLIAEVIPKLWEKDPEAVIERLEEIRQLNSSALMEMRSLLYELKAPAFMDESLGELLQDLVKSISVRTAIPIKVDVDGEYKFSAKIELGFYRIAQEAMNNIIKHSHAEHAVLVLKAAPGEIYMEINDDGKGFSSKKVTSTNLGLAIMKERAKLIGASINIKSIPGEGTKVTVIYKKRN
jgi:signal transduction histidine kinase